MLHYVVEACYPPHSPPTRTTLPPRIYPSRSLRCTRQPLPILKAGSRFCTHQRHTVARLTRRYSATSSTVRTSRMVCSSDIRLPAFLGIMVPFLGRMFPSTSNGFHDRHKALVAIRSDFVSKVTLVL